ncbi:guanine deaminase [Alteromonas sp. ASW11-19]|uniref:Guanine deaminase n=1 Tax=Alteromonas salexigens TaxID=2982530 RepID=A0ABT2VN25_9ALTE|nr:guanine deaminase [Alteromonas salexigens]MCU7553873.1 guanine deaminase [Alteromonas salexigens]
MQTKLIRASVAHFPAETSMPDTDIAVFPDGALVIRGEKILAVGEYSAQTAAYPEAKQINCQGKWLLPGFIDSHLHFPQTAIMGSYGEQLLTWLNTFTFPAEQRFADEQHASVMAQVFLGELLKNGTTSALVFSSVHKGATNALFSAAKAMNMTLVAGKVCMDRHCPDALSDTAASAVADSHALIERWHDQGRLRYAITPRFAPTSSDQQLAALGELAQAYPDVFIQTHLSENQQEVAWVKSLFPDSRYYLDVYDSHNMVRPRAVFGHCLHLEAQEWQHLSRQGATAAFCPSSNLFLGSGLFNMQAAASHGVNVALATDIGAGTSFSMLSTYADAYRTCQLQGTPLSPLQGLYMTTQGAAIAHQLDHEIGNLNPGTYADFVLLEPRCTPLSKLRLTPTADISDVVFALAMLGDERAVAQTWIAGHCCYDRDRNSDS